MEVEHNLVVARLDIDGTQDIVDTTHFGRLSVDCRCPLRIVNLREDNHSTVLRAYVVLQVVRSIVGKRSLGGRVICGTVAQSRLELLVGNCLVMEVNLADLVDFLIGIVDEVNLGLGTSC